MTLNVSKVSEEEINNCLEGIGLAAEATQSIEACRKMQSEQMKGNTCEAKPPSDDPRVNLSRERARELQEPRRKDNNQKRTQ
jgi:hypothetical protein